MFDYESPIKIIEQQMQMDFENNVLNAIKSYGVVVDKDELIKALQYDRNQYEKGQADMLDEVIKKLSESADTILSDKQYYTLMELKEQKNE